MYKTCFYCGEKLSKKQRTVDHVVPRKKGGSNKLDNLVVACRKCNWEKDDMDLSEYIKLKLNNFDFSSRYNLNKRPKEYGFEGTIYKTETVSISDMICKPPSQPSSHKIWVRKKEYLQNKIFCKPTHVKKRGEKYIILNGYINYIICKELGIKSMDVLVVLNKNPKKRMYQY